MKQKEERSNLLQVYVGEIEHNGKLVRGILAVPTKKAACDILGINSNKLATNWHLSDDKAELELARENPKCLLVASDLFSIDYRLAEEEELSEAA